MATDPSSRWLVSTDWLAQRLGAPDIVAVDGSFYLPALKRDAKAEYLADHIPGRGVLRHRRHRRPLHQPAAHAAERRAVRAATSASSASATNDTIVVYDGAGLGGAPRVWWTFRTFGAKNVFILDGGLPKWKAEGRPARGRRGHARAAQVRSRR